MNIKEFYNKKFLKIIGFVFLLFMLLLWIFTVYLVGADQLVSMIGLKNVYLLVLLAALLGGSSSFTSASFFTFFITLVNTSANPLLLSLAGGLGLSLGDSIFFYLGNQTHKIKNDKLQKNIKKFSSWLKKKKLLTIYIIIFIYHGLLPLPGDILNIVLGLAKIKYKKVIPIIIISNISLLLLISFLLDKNKFLVKLLT